MRPVHILIADDHAVLRQGLKLILAEAFAMASFGEAESTPETLRLLRQDGWDVLVLDLNMPGRGGLDLLIEARREYPRLPILVLSSMPEDQIALRVIRSGASGYLNKRVATEELVTAVRKVAGGGRYVSASLAERLAQEFGGAHSLARHESLSAREFQVLRLLAEGRSVSEIATQLALSPKTISTFRARVLRKLGVRNDIELVHYVRDQGLFEHGA